ncbi:MAG: hypothetical protein JKY56_09725 [Kofleriaceae bacterium]|nr:hypothetical protein [Kofleriaceae bacterium]
MKYSIAVLILVVLTSLSGSSYAQDCSECRGDEVAAKALESHANSQLRVWSRQLALSGKQISAAWAIVEAGHVGILEIQKSNSDMKIRLTRVKAARVKMHKELFRLLTASQKKDFAGLRPPHDISRNHSHTTNRRKRRGRNESSDRIYTEDGLKRRLSAVIKKWSREVPLSSTDISTIWTVLEKANKAILEAQKSVSDTKKRQQEITVILAGVHKKVLSTLSEEKKKKYLERGYFY